MHEQIRKDLDTADRVVRACWGNFVATEPTYVLRDLIVVEIQKAREAEREACAAICDECNRQDESDNGAAMTGAASMAAERIRARS